MCNVHNDTIHIFKAINSWQQQQIQFFFQSFQNISFVFCFYGTIFMAFFRGFFIRPMSNHIQVNREHPIVNNSSFISFLLGKIEYRDVNRTESFYHFQCIFLVLVDKLELTWTYDRFFVSINIHRRYPFPIYRSYLFSSCRNILLHLHFIEDILFYLILKV